MHTKRRPDLGPGLLREVVAPLVVSRPSRHSILDGMKRPRRSMLLACHESAGQWIGDHDSCQDYAKTYAGDATKYLVRGSGKKSNPARHDPDRG